MSSVVTRIESGRRLRIPAEWGDEFGPEHEVELIRCEEGILVKPLPKTPVQAALERKLPMNRPATSTWPTSTWTRSVGRRSRESDRLQFVGLRLARQPSRHDGL